jgi:ParB/RepB/Spo0J family partition protein
MATTAPTAAAGLTLPLARIHVPENVRALNAEHVDALAASVALQGMLVPIVVCPVEADVAATGFEYELVAGFHRVAAADKLGLVEVPAVIRDSAGEQSDRAVENIARLQLGPAEEAAAVKAMLDKGLTEDGAAQALGWPKARVTARVKLLELPEKARELVGTGVIPLSAVGQLRAIGTVSPPLLEVLVDYLDGDQDGPTWAASQLVSDPGYVLGNALRESDSKVFAAYLHQLPSGAVDELRLGKKATEQLAEAEKLHRQINQYAYGPPPIRFTEQDVDQARAAGGVIELDHSTPIIVDRPLYRELAKGAVKRTVEELREHAERAKTERKQDAARRNGSKPEDTAEDARREHGRRVRELAEQAHGANLDLGWALMNNLATVDPGDTTVAKFFVYGLLGGDYDGSPHTQSGDLVAELAVRGIRLVIEEFRADVTKTLKDGSRGKLRIDYGDPKQPEKPIAWLWRFIDGAKTAGELFCGSKGGTGEYEISPSGVGGASSVVRGSVRTGWDRREPCSRRCLRPCRSRVALRFACVRPGISAIGASATAPTSSSRRRTPICGSCGMAAVGRWGRRRSTRGTSPSSLTGAPDAGWGWRKRRDGLISSC